MVRERKNTKRYLVERCKMGQPWKTYLVVALIVGVLIGAGVGWVSKPVERVEVPGETVRVTETVAGPTVTVTETPEVPPVGLTGEVLIGTLLPLTGVLATYGENSMVGVDLAVEEVNAFLKASGAKWTMRVIHEDTETKPDVALTKCESLAAKGVKFIIGPQASAGVKNIKGYCDANKILVVSQSSTSPALAIPGDFVFRFCPTDVIQGPALARLMWDAGSEYVVATWRGDAWGDALVEAARVRFEELGGTFVETVRYPGEALEFSAEAKAINDAVTSAVASYGADKVGVLLVAFEEAAIYFTSIAEYPVLWDVQWFGSDGTTGSLKMIEEPACAEFCSESRFVNPIFAPTRSPKFAKVEANGLAKLGRAPDSYVYAAYDIVWALAYSLLTVDAYDPEAVRAVLPDVTESMFGASGWVVLNEDGDRAAADYDLWVIAEIAAGQYEWKHVGVYVQATDSVTWF